MCIIAILVLGHAQNMASVFALMYVILLVCVAFVSFLLSKRSVRSSEGTVSKGKMINEL